MDQPIKKIHDRWVLQAMTILESGKGHIGVITFLRSEGLAMNEAKTASYRVFDEALLRLNGRQRPHRFLAWGFIVVGLLSPLVTYIMGRCDIFMALALLIIGCFILVRLRRPTRLPANESSEQNAALDS